MSGLNQRFTKPSVLYRTREFESHILRERILNIMTHIIPSDILRKRLIIEAIIPDARSVTREQIIDFLGKLATTLDMTIIHGPNAHDWSRQKGFGANDGMEGYVIWAESGAQVYTWDAANLLTVDIYTCKNFDNQKAVELTEQTFACTKILFKEVEPLLI